MVYSDIYYMEIVGKSNYYILREYVAFTTPEAEYYTNKQYDLRC